ncbi:MAG: DEAD/DEAH box helicase [Gammaproteobacteria bacterium]
MEIKEYQTEAVRQMLESGGELLRQRGNKKMVFKSPTGSGKTVMMAELLKRLADGETPKPLAFVWVAPRKLHAQSRDKLEKHYEDSIALDCVFFYDLTDKQIGENEVLFLNWESIRQENKNTIVRENEQEFYLGKVVQNTVESGLDIVLVIDESHHHAKSEMSQKLIAEIAPKLTIDVSATPKAIDAPDAICTVPLEYVVQAGMIKKSVILNEGFKNLLADDSVRSALAEKGDMFVLERALDKRKEIARAFDNAGAGVNPLFCIQLPDRKTAQEDNLKNAILRALKHDHDITVDNGKLAIYLSDEKENLENISRNDNGAEVLIFKQAIALGWDCPRAHILALFRDWRSVTFSVQTLGRIMRMPEPAKGHYDDGTLDRAYVYTNLPNISIGEGVGGGYLSVYTSRLIDGCEPVKLSSVHRLRQREMTRLSPQFIDLFLQAADNYELAEKLQTQGQKVQTALIADYEQTSIDTLAGETIAGRERLDVSNAADLQKLFDYFVRDNLSPYYPEERSINRVKDAIYKFYLGKMNINYEVSDRIIGITLSEDNCWRFERVLTDAKDLYKRKTAERKELLQKTQQWELPETVVYGDNYSHRKVEKSAMKPFYAAKNEPQTEKAFIKYLEAASVVKWWYKNGESESLYFAVPYVENDEEKPFYADFIVHFNDGTVGIYDTKSGITVATAQGKSDGLRKYIREENKRRKEGQLKGGIITPDNKEYSQWRIYIGKGKDIGKPNSPDWEGLDF